MNYLAHMFLSFKDEDILIGNLSGDFVTVAELRFIKPEIMKGIHLHRSIDKFTDTNTIVDQSINRLAAKHGKYASVIVDILYDHLLCINWEKYTDESLDSFKSAAYDILSKRKDDMPRRLFKRIDKMLASDFVEGYRSAEGMKIVMKYMDKRTRFESNFVSSIDDLYADMEAFEGEFNQFFPLLVSHSEQTLVELNAAS